MNAIELISAGVTAMGFGAIVWAIAHESAREDAAEPEPAEPPDGDDWRWDAPYTALTETDASFLNGDFQESIDSGLTESLADYEQRLRDRNYRTATTARQRHQNQTGDPK